MTERYGAKPQEWSHLDLVCGLTADLLPVVSNPAARISSASKMKALGKTPSVYTNTRRVVGVHEWTRYVATQKDIQRWAGEQDYGICIQTRQIRAIDIDINDAQIVRDVLLLCETVLGRRLPKRFRASGEKCLLAFRLPGQMQKRILRADAGLVEFLADGQQFIAHGTHPSGARYEWEWAGHNDFPDISSTQFEELWGALSTRFGQNATPSGPGRHSAATPRVRTDDKILDKLNILAWGREGEAYIQCPWQDQHTMDSGVTQTAYFPAGSRGYEQGHFRCLHAHCEERSDVEFLDALGLRVADFEVLTADPQPEEKTFNIRLRGGHLPEEIVTAEEALLAAHVPYYQRGSSIVRPVVEMLNAAKGRKTQVVQLFDVDVPYLTHDLCKAATWLTVDGRKGQWKKINPPPVIAVTLLANYGHWRFPKVSGVITTPTLRPDGSVLCKEGFDEATGLLLVGMPRMPEIPHSPTKEEALAALQLLKSLLVEFPFVAPADHSVALSALITPVVRGAFQVAPMHVIRAPAAGSGKSFLLDVASAIAIGQPCPVMAAGRNEEETEKRLGAALMAGQPIISIDNVNGALGGDFLCQLVERPVVEVRILGKSQMVKIESRSTIFATGNNIHLIGDMTRRCLLCMLDANSERPELRRFDSNPVEKVLGERGKYIAAALTVVRAYIIAGCPAPSPNLASFGEWSDTVRSALVWLGEEDPAQSMEAARAEDPTLQNTIGVLEGMRECLGLGVAASAAQIVGMAEGVSNDMGEDKPAVLREAITNVAGVISGRISAKLFGKWLGANKGRIAGGLRLCCRTGRSGHGAQWWVEEEESLI